jgi:hydroxymethylbilane synthase
MLRSLQGGCSSPVGVFSSFIPQDGIDTENVENGSYSIGNLKLHGTVLDIEGTKSISAQDSVTVQSDDDAEQLGVSVARMLLREGANSLLSKGS